jgi:hypothetical protein
VLVRGFDGHRERFMITGICRPEVAHSLSSTAPLASLGQSEVPRR